MKTLAIRLGDELHARLSMLAKLAGSTVTDTMRAATEQYLDTLSSDPTITAKAEELRAEIEMEAAQQRDALAALIGTTTKKPAKATASRGSRSAKE